ncbi:MarR family transcriptional regulator [Nonomuraea sp. B12E4]|uniref:MarR family winged helix-turn-helix transcriptional regulator n=1 Tax=Nonomuraea sp. B12E4 TaxID=3153564 RepID=UPI00325F6695
MAPAASVPSTALPSDAVAMWHRVMLLHSRVEGVLAAALQRRHGIGLSEYRALGHLAVARDGELRMQELAELIGLNQSSVTRLVARLNAAGFAYRDLCPDDKRGVYCVVTDAGRAKYGEASRTYEETLTVALEEAGQTDPQLAAAVTLLGESIA